MVKERRGAAGREDGLGAGLEAREGKKEAGRPRARSDRIPDRATRSKSDSRPVPSGRNTGAPEPLVSRHLAQGPVWTGRAGPRAGWTGSLTGTYYLSRPDPPKSVTFVPFRPVSPCGPI
jgi:hypothetical protein